MNWVVNCCRKSFGRSPTCSQKNCIISNIFAKCQRILRSNQFEHDILTLTSHLSHETLVDLFTTEINSFAVLPAVSDSSQAKPTQPCVLQQN